MIGEDDAGRSVGFEHHMIMLAGSGVGRGGFIDELPQLLGFALGIDRHTPAHAEMDHQGLVAVEFGQNVFGPSPQRRHPSSRQPGGKILGKGGPEVAPPGLHFNEFPALHGGGQTHANSFDFGKLRHYGQVMSTESHTDHTASFGFRDVPEDEKEKLVRGVFSSVAKNYDLMNDLMSGGVHRLWKDAFVGWLNPQPGWKSLDVAGGTGDIAFRIAKAIRKKGGEPDITVCDINPDMLSEGVARADKKGETALTWVTGDAQQLPMPDNSFDSYTIAFGIRNVTRIEKALEEARRVLKPGGRFLCLEFSQVVVPGLDVLYDKFSFHILPKIGGYVARDREAYQYLVESIRRFPPQDKFARMISEAGLSNVKVRNLSGGIAAMHSAWKI